MCLPCFSSTAGTHTGSLPTGASVHSHPLLDVGQDWRHTERGEGTARFFCSNETAGVRFPFQALSAKRPTFTTMLIYTFYMVLVVWHLAKLGKDEGVRGGKGGGGVEKTAARQNRGWEGLRGSRVHINGWKYWVSKIALASLRTDKIVTSQKILWTPQILFVSRRRVRQVMIRSPFAQSEPLPA